MVLRVDNHKKMLKSLNNRIFVQNQAFFIVAIQFSTPYSDFIRFFCMKTYIWLQILKIENNIWWNIQFVHVKTFFLDDFQIVLAQNVCLFLIYSFLAKHEKVH